MMRMESQHRGGEGGGFLWTIFGVAFQRRTYASLFYLLIGAPVAVAFWVALVTLLAVGGGLSITVVGIPLLLATNLRSSSMLLLPIRSGSSTVKPTDNVVALSCRSYWNI